MWRSTSKHVIAAWARAQPGVVSAIAEQNTPDVVVQFADGAQVAIELRHRPLADDDWLAQHNEYLRQQITDVWLWAPDQHQVPWIVARHGQPLWYFDLEHRRVSTMIARGHPRPENWYRAADLSIYARHMPPCVNDRCDDIVRDLDRIGLNAYGFTLPPDDMGRLIAGRDAVHDHAATLRREDPKPVPEPVPARKRPAEPVPGIPVKRCVKCGEHLDALVYHDDDDRHILC